MDTNRYVVECVPGSVHTIRLQGSLGEEMVLVPMLTTQARLAGLTTTF